MSRAQIESELESALQNICEAVTMIQDDDLDMAISELEIAHGSLGTRIEELKKLEGSY